MSCAGQQTFTKDPEATLDYTWDWTAWLGSDEIDTHEFTAASGITIVMSSHTPKTAKVWLKDGTLHETYDVTCRIATTGMRTDERTVKIGIDDQ